MPTYKSIHTGKRVDDAVTKIPDSLPTEDGLIVVKADGSASEYISKSSVLGDKLDKQTAQTESDQIYGKLADGSQTMFDVTMGAEPTTIPRRDTAGRIQVADGVSGTDAVNFQQLDEIAKDITGLNIENGAGTNALQQKQNTKATGSESVAFGGKYNLEPDKGDLPPTTAAGIQAFAANGSNIVNGNVAAGFGKENVVDGDGSFVEGGGNHDLGVSSGRSFNHIEGTVNNVEGNVNHVEGSGNNVTSQDGSGTGKTPDIANFLHVEGLHNTVPAKESDKAITVHVEGQGNTVTGSIIHVEGLQNTSSGNTATHIEGSYNSVSKSSSSHIAGQGNTVQNVTNSYIAGQGNTVQKGTGVYVFGNNCVSTDDWSYSTGYNTKAGEYAFSGGQYTNAAALASFAVNTSTFAEMPYSAAFGNTTRSRRESQLACGEFTNENAKYATRALLVVGNGTKDVHSNAFEVLKDGRARIYGVPTEDEDAVRKLELDTKLNKPDISAASPHRIVIYNGLGETGVLAYTNNPSSSTIMQRDGNGRSQVADGASGKDIVNYSQLDKKYDKTGGTVGGNVVITGDLTVNGTQHINNTENLNVENAMIYSNATGATLATNGGIGIKKNANDVYGIVYDPASDSVKLGLGTAGEDGRFVFNENEGEPVAVRDDSSKLTNDHLIKWNSANNKLIDSGKTIDELLTTADAEALYVPRSTDQEGKFVLYSRTGTNVEGVTVLGTTDDLSRTTSVPVYRDSTSGLTTSGYLTTNVPINDYHAANKKFVEDNFVKVRKNIAADEFVLYGASANNPNDGVLMAFDAIGYTVPRRLADGQIIVGTPTEESHATTKKYVDDSLVTTPITETETVVVDTTTVNFALDAEHDTGMYVSAENAISLGSTQLDWTSGRDKYKVIWDGVEYIVYGQASTVTKLNGKLNNVDVPSGWYGWQLLGNGSNSKLMMYNKDTVNIPFAITQDRWKNSAEWLIYATNSTAATHTIKVIKIEGTYKKVTPEYQYGYVSMFNQNKDGLAVYGENAISDNVGSGIVAGYGNTIIADADSKGFTGDIIARGTYVNVSSATGEVAGANIEGSYNALYSSGAFYSPFLAGYMNLLKNNGVDWLSPFVAGYKNTIIANKGTVHPDAVFGSNHTITYDGNTTYGLNLVAGNSHTIKNAALSLIAGLANTVECLEADKYIGSNIVGGQLNTVNHSRVIVGGGGNTSDRNSQFIAGNYSAANEHALVKIGNGTKDARANAFEVLDDNRAKVFGTPIENNDVLRYQDTAIEIETSLMGA